MVLVTTDYIIQQSSKIKVLGYIISSSLDNQAYINSIIQKINYRSNILKDIFKYSNYRTKNILSTSIQLSTFRYAEPLLIDSTKLQLQSFQTLLMKTTRLI